MGMRKEILFKAPSSVGHILARSSFLNSLIVQYRAVHGGSAECSYKSCKRQADFKEVIRNGNETFLGSGLRQRRPALLGGGGDGLHAHGSGRQGVGGRLRHGEPHLRRLVRQPHQDHSRRRPQRRRNGRHLQRHVRRHPPQQASAQSRRDPAGRAHLHLLPDRLPLHERPAADDGRVHLERARRTGLHRRPDVHREPRSARTGPRQDGPRSHQGHGRAG